MRGKTRKRPLVPRMNKIILGQIDRMTEYEGVAEWLKALAC